MLHQHIQPILCFELNADIPTSLGPIHMYIERLQDFNLIQLYAVIAPFKYFHHVLELNSESPLTCRNGPICKPIHHEGELLYDKSLSLCSSAD